MSNPDFPDRLSAYIHPTRFAALFQVPDEAFAARLLDEKRLRPLIDDAIAGALQLAEGESWEADSRAVAEAMSAAARARRLSQIMTIAALKPALRRRACGASLRVAADWCGAETFRTLMHGTTPPSPDEPEPDWDDTEEQLDALALHWRGRIMGALPTELRIRAALGHPADDEPSILPVFDDCKAAVLRFAATCLPLCHADHNPAS